MVSKLRKTKLLPTAVIVAALIMLPTAANVYAQTTTDDDTTTDETTSTKEQTTTNETTQNDPVVSEEPTVTNPETPTTTEETPAPVLTAVTLAQAQAIAETEHSSSVVVSSKTKAINNVTTYVFMFADGWKVYVRASDGTVVKVQDKSNKDHACQNKHKETGVHGVSTPTRKSAEAHATNAGQDDNARHRGNGHGFHKSEDRH